MAFDDLMAGRVREALAHRSDVAEKAMFGGIAFMVGGRMCISVGRDRLMCRIDPAQHDLALQNKGCRTVVMKGRRYRGYVHVDQDVVKSKGDLNDWIELLLDYNDRLRSSPCKQR